MKKKLLTLLLTVFALTTCVFTLTACNHQHSYTMEVIEPTCTTGGCSNHTCSCGDIYTDNFVNPLGHSFTNYISDNNATFYADGTKTATCDRNGCNVTDTTTDIGTKFSNGLKYALNSDNKSYSVTGLGTCTDTNVVIPSTYKNKPVTNIGYRAFYDCDSLTSVKIGNSVTSISYDAFFFCDSLTSVTIGNSVTSIWDDAFYSCDSLIWVDYLGTIDDWVQIEFSNRDSNPLYYANNLYISNQLVTEANITTATKINNYAFDGCDSLTSVEIPDSVTSIGVQAFSGCDSLTSIEIPNSVTSIGDEAFAYCDNLTSVTIGNSVTNIGDDAFYYCNYLTNIKVDANNTTYKDIDGNLYSKDGTTLIQYAIGKTQTTFTISNSVTSIGDYAFYNCDSLTSVTIPNSVTSIGDGAFCDCNSLTSIEIPNSVTSIGYQAFSGCDSLIYNIKENLKYLGNSSNLYLYLAGVEDKSITTATINSNCKFIGSSAFRVCDSLTRIVIPNSVTSIGDWAFAHCDSLTSIVLPNSVTSIGSSAFGRCGNLISVTIGNSVTSIGNYAFNFCSSLTSIEIPSSVTSIGKYAFNRCDRLTSITFADTTIWYRTANSSDWQNKTNGTETNVTDPSTNDSYFKSTYSDYYWYKK